MSENAIHARVKRAGVIAAASSVARALTAPYYRIQALGVRAPERLHVAPPDIRTADPTVADEVYAGYFSFDGKIVHTQGRSPFSIDPPSAAWRRSLAGFSWLRHLRAADKALARANARALVADFLTSRTSFLDDPAFEPSVVARRTLSWLAQSPLLLEEADQDFYESVMAALARNMRVLLGVLAGEGAGTDRLLCAVALAEFGVCADAGRQFVNRATHLLDLELSRQILRDGGHVGRNPDTLVELLLDLLPLRQAYAARGRRPPQRLLASIERMIPMLRMLQHGDGSLALFNGMGPASPDRLAIILAHDEGQAAPPLDAPHSGYRRMQAGDSLVLVDTGAPPPQAFSYAAHAGCLSFEYSIGGERIVVNCGAPPASSDLSRQLARSTAAHSTLVVEDRSSSQIAGPGARSRAAGKILAGPRQVSVERRSTKSGEVLELSHDGYAREFGLVHLRKLALTHDGARLVGEDKLVAANGTRIAAQPRGFVLRFHMHPNVRLSPTDDGRSVEIAAGGSRLIFEATGLATTIEESVFFAVPGAARKCEQIVVIGRGQPEAHVRWSFTRIGQGAEELVSPSPDI